MKYKVGDRVALTGKITEICEATGEQYTILVDFSDFTEIWVKKDFLKDAEYKIGDEVSLTGEVEEIDEDIESKPIYVDFGDAGGVWVGEDQLRFADRSYAEGLADAWKLARKIENELDCSTLESLFGSSRIADVLDNFSVEEVFAKIEANEGKREIGVEDEVCFSDGTKAIVLDEISDTEVYVFTDVGCVEKKNKKYLTKTGNHCGCVKELLQKIGG